MSNILYVSLVAVGFLAAFLLKKPFAIGRNLFTNQAPLIKKYWLIIIPYLIALGASYTVVGKYFYSSINFEILGQIASILLAVFIGYIAFAELSENRFDKHRETGRKSGRRNHLKSAVVELEAAYAIKPKDADVLADLLELWLLTGRHDRFASNIERYNSITIEDYEILNYYFLKTLSQLIEEHLKDAREIIGQTIDTVKTNHDVWKKFSWDFDQLHESDVYKKMGTESKKLLDTYIEYLTGALTPEQIEKFEKENTI